MIEDLLHADATVWQRDIDGGARPVIRRRRPDWRPLAAAAVVVLVVAGAAIWRTRSDGSTPAASGNLADTRWVDPASHGELDFARASVRIFDTCTSRTHRLRVTGSTLTIGAAFGSGSSCAGGFPSAARQRFDRIITGTIAWTRDGDTLRLTRGGESVILRAERAITLTDTTWRLEQIPALVTGDSVPPGTTLSIGSDGTVRAGDQCATITGHATITDDSVTFRTRTNCVDPGFSPSTREIIAVLTSTASYEIRGNQLTLIAGHHALVYRTG